MYPSKCDDVPTIGATKGSPAEQPPEDVAGQSPEDVTPVDSNGKPFGAQSPEHSTTNDKTKNSSIVGTIVKSPWKVRVSKRYTRLSPIAKAFRKNYNLDKFKASHKLNMTEVLNTITSMNSSSVPTGEGAANVDNYPESHGADHPIE